MAGSLRSETAVSLKSILAGASFPGTEDIFIQSCSASIGSAPFDSNHLFVAGLDLINEDEDEMIAAAIQRGASAILTERLLPISIPQCLVGDARMAYGQILHAIADKPTQKMLTIGVMGTHGKTTASLLIASMLKKIAGGVAYHTSLGISPEKTKAQAKNKSSKKNGNSSPEDKNAEVDGDVRLANRLAAQSITEWLAMAAASETPAVVIELNDAMLLDRTAAGVDFDLLVIPSLRAPQRNDRMEARGIETGILRTISQLKDHGLVIYNADDARLNRWIDRHQVTAIGYGLDADAKVRGKRLSREMGSQTMMVSAGRSLMPLTTNLPGDHHLRHMLAAVSVGYAFGLELFEVIAGAQQLSKIPGRMQSVVCGQPFSVFVDTADQADRLAVALHSMAPIGGPITCVAEVPDCMCEESRAAFGRVLNRGASRMILTQSRQTTSLGLKWMWEVIDGCDHPASVQIVPNRAAAIELALRSAQPGEQVLLAGWGAGSWTNSNDKQVFTDIKVAESVLYKLVNEEKSASQVIEQPIR